MTTPAIDDPELVILALLGVLCGFGDKDHGLMNRIVRGEQHTPGCPRGMYLRPDDRLTNGSPCSERCETARLAVSWAVAWLWANRPADLGLEAAG